MKNDVPIKNNIIIPEHELEITASRSSGAGGQHVNKTSTRITIRWNVKNTSILNHEQKERVLTKLEAQLTTDGDLIIHSSESRSQDQNRTNAINKLTHIIRQALYVPKKRMATKVSKSAKEARLQSKTRHGHLKKMRTKNIDYE